MTRYLITSALPYINGVKHLGNLVGSMLPADVYARYLRKRGHEVLFICATDEHGTPAELAAIEAGLDVAEYCRQMHLTQAALGEKFHLSFDHFGRSSSAQNRELTQHFARRLEENGFLEERNQKQIYSLADGRFLPDRYVIGTCPHCGYVAARGDQCESCTKVLDPIDLISPRSAISGSTALELRETKHLFLLQSKLAEEIRAWVEQHADWPLLVRSIALKWLNEGLRDRCITRDLTWGVPVDRPGFEGKVYYVWFDAPIEYIAATKEWSEADPAHRDWKSWWYSAADVKYVQFMAKDNVPFHTVSFPGTIIGSREPWKLVDYIKGFNWLNYYGGKFSTSGRRGVFMSDAIDILPSDYWRYSLLANIPETSDAEFTWEQFAATVNKDLADTFGNFVHRILKFVTSRFGPAVPDGGTLNQDELGLAESIERGVSAYCLYLDDLQLRKAMQELKAIWTIGNTYIDKAAPWSVIKTDQGRAACILRTGVNLVRVFSLLAWPVIPVACEKVFRCLQLDASEQGWITGNLLSEIQRLGPGRALAVSEPLFRKITDEEIAAWTERFSGAS